MQKTDKGLVGTGELRFDGTNARQAGPLAAKRWSRHFALSQPCVYTKCVSVGVGQEVGLKLTFAEGAEQANGSMTQEEHSPSAGRLGKHRSLVARMKLGCCTTQGSRLQCRPPLIHQTPRGSHSGKLAGHGAAPGTEVIPEKMK